MSILYKITIEGINTKTFPYI